MPGVPGEKGNGGRTGRSLRRALGYTGTRRGEPHSPAGWGPREASTWGNEPVLLSWV